MTRDGDSKRNGEAKHRLIPLAMVLSAGIAFGGAAFGYGALSERVEDNAEDIDRIEMRIEKQLAAINKKLDLLFSPRTAR